MKLIETFEKLNQLQKILVMAILGLVVFGVSTSVSFSIFSNFKPSQLTPEGKIASLPSPANIVEEDPSEPKTEECPLDGSKHTKKTRESWEKRRPLAVMIENHGEARPQSGLSSANVVYEAIAEGGITRFMAIFYCNLSDVQVGPVRSARTYFLDWLSEWNDPLYAHVGGANTPGPADALDQIITYKIKSLNQFGIGFPTYWRDYQRLGHAVATEHTMYSTTQKLWAIGAKRGLTATNSAGLAWSKNFIPWKFKAEANEKVAEPNLPATKIDVTFWENQSYYQVNWSLDQQSKSYKRKNGGSDHIDLNNKKQLEPKNIVIQFEKESNANDGYPGNVHLVYGTIGTGKALIFQNGKVIEGKWNKISRLARTKYTDSKGKEIEFNRGQIWIQTVPEGSKVTY